MKLSIRFVRFTTVVAIAIVVFMLIVTKLTAIAAKRAAIVRFAA